MSLRCLAFLLLFCPAAPALAQLAVAPQDGVLPVVQAHAVAELPVLDGDVLGDAAWTAAVPVSTFWQTTPDEGAPASERTEVRVIYTATTLYVGVVLYDRQPDRIIISDSRRDASLDETDSFRIILDTFDDGQNGFVFGTNAAGIEYDAQVTNEGQGGGGFAGGRQQGGAGGGFNLNWDGSWTVKTQVSDVGWSAEFAIPFRTLRFATGAPQTWGINFERTIRRHNERSYWSPLPRQYNLYRVSRAGTLQGLEVPAPRNLQVMPYVLAQGSRGYGAEAVSRRMRGDFGGDAKYGVTPSLTLDLTYNTDFAQVEVDEQQVNLDRFNLFFPEKRPFFLENAGIFAVGDPGEVELFFSRRIGVGPGGVGVPILAGARLSGEAAGTKLGFLNMQTEGVPGITSGSNFGVARLKRELPNRSSVGVLFTNRQRTGEVVTGAFHHDYNRLLAVDGQLGIGRYGSVTGFAAHTFTPGIPGAAYAYKALALYDAERWDVSTSYAEVADGFNPEVGFLRRQDYRKWTGAVMRRYRPANLFGLLELRPHVRYEGYWGRDGFHETGFLHVDNHWEWKNGYEIHTGFNVTREGVRRPFQIARDVIVPQGTYDHREAQFIFMTDRSQWLSFSMRTFIGGFFGGDRVSLTPSLRMRVGEAFNASFSLSRNAIDLPGGDFVTNLVQARLSYSFSPRIYLQSLVQYNDNADLWSANLRFGWLQSAGTGFFIVFNQTNDLDDFDRFGGVDRFMNGVRDRSVIIKYSRLFNVLQ